MYIHIYTHAYAIGCPLEVQSPGGLGHNGNHFAHPPLPVSRVSTVSP